MDDLVRLAAMNNVLQSEAVLAALGSTGSFTGDSWINDHTFDIPYANGATLGPAEHAARHLRAVEQFTARRPHGTPTYIMDSRASLDLEPLGYRVRIADEWFVRTSPVEPLSDPRVAAVTTAAALADFEAASVAGFGGTAPTHPGHTYSAALLDDHRFQFFYIRIDGELAAGVFLFQDRACVGVYTFFTLPAFRGQGLGTSVLRHALSHAPNLPLATNPSEMSRGIFERLGFEPVGERRIWTTAAAD